jgi:hypothetical protein
MRKQRTEDGELSVYRTLIYPKRRIYFRFPFWYCNLKTGESSHEVETSYGHVGLQNMHGGEVQGQWEP